MNRSFRNLLILIAGLVALIGSFILDAILIDAALVHLITLAVGLVVTIYGAYLLRDELKGALARHRVDALSKSAGLIGIVVAICYLSIQFPFRVDMTGANTFSLSEDTVTMLESLETPVHITFFHNPLMRETVEFYQEIASTTDKVTVEFHDPMLNPSIARLRGVEFAGTALMESEGRQLQVHSPLEVEIANGILKISQGLQQKVCFLDGHGEPDPFSLEQHDHNEGDAGHDHGLGTQYVLHERHGMAKFRGSLESMNYVVEKISLLQSNTNLDECAVVVVAGPQTPLMPEEVKIIDDQIARGSNFLFMLDPFVETGLEPVIEKLGVILEDSLVLDPESHFWSDISSPAVTKYNRHTVTDDLPLSFFPGARALSPTKTRVPETYVRPLVNTSRESFGETDLSAPDFTEGVDQKGPLTLMVIVNRDPSQRKKMEGLIAELRDDNPSTEVSTPDSKKSDEQDDGSTKSRIAIIGDSDFATNSFFHVLGNGKLALSTVNYLSAQENLIGLEPKSLDIPRVNLTNTQMKGTIFLSIIFIPALMAFIGVAVWWRRR